MWSVDCVWLGGAKWPSGTTPMTLDLSTGRVVIDPSQVPNTGTGLELLPATACSPSPMQACQVLPKTKESAPRVFICWRAPISP